jgi:hypothetical protein
MRTIKIANRKAKRKIKKEIDIDEFDKQMHL